MELRQILTVSGPIPWDLCGFVGVGVPFNEVLQLPSIWRPDENTRLLALFRQGQCKGVKGLGVGYGTTAGKKRGNPEVGLSSVQRILLVVGEKLAGAQNCGRRNGRLTVAVSRKSKSVMLTPL